MKNSTQAQTKNSGNRGQIRIAAARFFFNVSTFQIDKKTGETDINDQRSHNKLRKYRFYLTHKKGTCRMF